ncbi:conjugal transfer protein TraJ [Wolbachia endosymbiont of Dirofilaria (Dirofilaria) immitis]|uniref:conjugal transfer protein TraJ n=1 Tax=Wolbachia endosymbiont of Dirofilaria (Dirofilaria) immitis TaxID=1812115 RepID=UPI0015899776|nr:conjugal transfer protein TraJ [Wolbachia endosymbiont of Dirofilaria (Dirofilaria) immitis]QKX02575.1 conjugal transfer protein TraJ [Wolbachia endosymbiont of Dirofilaria (Dirofilaria) immitis]
MENRLFESVKNKSYFNKAVEWYCHRYLFCVVERSWMVVIVSFLLVCLCLLLLNIYLLFPVKKDLNFIRYANHTEDEFSVMRKLNSNEKKDEYISTARYLINKYIKVYESNKIVESECQKIFVKNNSTHRIYQSFQEKVNNEAGDLPFVKRKITNINVTKLFIDRSVEDLVAFPGNATVFFIIEQNKKVKKQTVDISFTLSNIKAALDGMMPFKFIVDGYKYR